MKIITTLAAIAGLAALSACAGGDADENADTTLQANTLVVDNLETPADNMTMDMNAMDTNATDLNTTTDTTNTAANSTGNAY
jgi:hypothetical protein